MKAKRNKPLERIRALESEAYAPVTSKKPLAVVKGALGDLKQMKDVFLKVTIVDGPRSRKTANNKFLKNIAKRKR